MNRATALICGRPASQITTRGLLFQRLSAPIFARPISPSRHLHTTLRLMQSQESSVPPSEGSVNDDAAEIDFCAQPLSEPVLRARIATHLETPASQKQLTAVETVSLLRAVTVGYGTYAAGRLGLGDAEVLKTQRELLARVLSTEAVDSENPSFSAPLDCLILAPQVLRPVFLDLVNKDYRMASSFFKPGVDAPSTWEAQKQKDEKETQEVTEIFSTSDLVLDIMKAYNKKYSNAVSIKRETNLLEHDKTLPSLKQGRFTVQSVVPTYIPLPVAMIPFRRAVYNGELDKAFAMIDATVAGGNYMKAVRRKWVAYGTRWALGTSTVLASVDLLLRSGYVGTWTSTTGVLAMVLTYLCSMTILGGLAFAGRVSGSGEYIKWVPGTSTTYWYSHAQEMKMASAIAAVDRALPENQNEPSFRVKKMLQARHMMAIEAEQETLIKEYWARGGEGFEWIEPDQDPAEALWRKKMEASKALRIAAQEKYGDKYKWADELIADKSLPHASLSSLPRAPEPPAPKGLPEL
ncbi:uncharacterized protein SAPINGB_P000655 [Magnusiomyces paraingens]|uniref:Uncharacterized protein n=1 Tax=Magnusiomyces paraingens TaxID=2606893 RepID=A0A5E8B6C2_9ASCO|nr:uncharacterized protein SAPINGB_P000655 [Saprochaete ingens]VVT45153.1 unnamed protein product [Saprochaete ingens]